MGHDGSSIPPVPPPPPSPPLSISKGNTDHRSSTSVSKVHCQHVTFAPPPYKPSESGSHAKTSVRPIVMPTARSMPPSAMSVLPNTMVGQNVHYQLPNREIRGNPEIGSGIIRLSGGFHTTIWNKYEAEIPASEVHAANMLQRGNAMSGMVSGQPGNQFDSSGQQQIQRASNKSRIADIQDGVRRSSSRANTQTTTAVPTPNLAAAVPTADPSASNHSKSQRPVDALTSISRSPLNLAHARGSVASNSINPSAINSQSKSKKMKCCKCGEQKKDNSDNVKELKTRVQICWNCLVSTNSRHAVQDWLDAVS